MRLENFIENEHYHIFSKGVGKENIFIDDQDKARFIFLITHFQSPIKIYNISWYTSTFIKNNSFSGKKDRVTNILKKRNTKLVAFVLMPNYFHLLVQNLEDGILSVYMHRILTAYSKYFNAKYNKKGHVFETSFKAVHLKNNTQLLELSGSIHKNPKVLKEWEKTYDKYPYSSYQDYIGLNRWGNFLSTEVVLKQFKNQTKYKDFVTKGIIKEEL